MSAVPDDVVNALVRGIAAYLRATPATELPARLRRFRSFRPQGLRPHRDEILNALDSEAFRARILEWLDKEKPSLPKRDSEVLRVAAERADGYERKLGTLSSRSTRARARSSAAGDVGVRLEAEREKAKRARDDARKAREESRAAVQAERKKMSDLSGEISDLKRRATEAERDAAGSGREAAAATARMERERRKSKATADRAQEERDRARKELKEARRETASLKREIATLETRLARATRKPTQNRTQTAPRRRSRLPVPKGRLADAPETLTEWLRTPEVNLLIDGYNVAKAAGGFGSLPLDEQRAQLIKAMGPLARKAGGRTIIVFDGSKVPPGVARRSRGPVEVEYSRPDEIADDHIVARLEKMPADPVILITNDKELQRRGAKLGATVATSKQLLGLIR